jgi:hypothetical protein
MYDKELFRLKKQLEMMHKANTLMRIGYWDFVKSRLEVKIDHISSKILEFEDYPKDKEGNRHIPLEILTNNLEPSDRLNIQNAVMNENIDNSFSFRINYQ